MTEVLNKNNSFFLVAWVSRVIGIQIQFSFLFPMFLFLLLFYYDKIAREISLFDNLTDYLLKSVASSNEYLGFMLWKSQL